MKHFYIGGVTEEALKGGGSSDVVAAPRGRMIFLGGQVGQTPEGKIGENLRDQAFMALENVRLALEKAGARMEHVTQLTLYLSEDTEGQIREWWGIIGEACRHYFGDHKPAATGVWVKRLVLKKFLVEIQGIAVIPD